MRPAVAILVLASVPIAAGPAAAEVDLSLALARVYVENPRILAARAELHANDEAVPEARAGLRPRVSVRSGAFLRQLDTGSRSQHLTTLEESITLSQTLWDGGGTPARVAAAEAEVRRGRATLASVVQDVLLEAVAAFAAVVRDQAVLERALENERRLVTELGAARQRYRLGEVSRTDVAQAEARHAAARAARHRAAGQLEISGAAYRRVIGDPPGTLVPPEPPPGLPQRLDAALERVEFHPELVAARRAEEAARHEVAAARAALRPRLELSGGYSLTREAEAGAGFGGEASIGAVVSWPLYQGGGEYARLRRSRQLAHTQRFRTLDVERALREEVVAAFEALASAREQLEALAVRRDAARLALAGMREEMQAGTRTVTDVLDAERDLFDAEVDELVTRYAEVVAGYRLLAAMGELDPDRLGLPVARYDDTAYYREVRGRLFGIAEPEVEPARMLLDGKASRR